MATTPAAIDPPLQLAHFNLLASNRSHAAVTTWITGSGAALVSLQEVDDRWAAVLAAVPGYRLLHALPRTDNFGLAILLRDDALSMMPTVAPLELAGMPALAVQLQHAGRPITVLSLHTLPPVSRRYAETRDAQLAAAAAWAQAQRDEGLTPVILGDLNATPFSSGLAPLIAADLQDSLTAGSLWTAGSWPDLPWPLRIAIDHCWHDAGLVASDRVIGPALGSDHRPLRLDLRWAR
jgi:endonuclease/exonuclease/phosphatase (EEP) superfamily protein YafD